MAGARPNGRRREKPEIRRQEILEEATRLIGERGYYGFNLRELAERCKISKAGLFHHYPTKEELLIEVLKDRDSRDAAATASLLGASSRATPKQPLTFRQVLDVFHATAVRSNARPELVRLFAIIQAEALNAGHPAHAYITARQAEVVRSYEQIIAPYVADAPSLARQLVITIDGLQQEWLRTGQGFDLVDEWDRAVARLLPAVAPEATAPATAPAPSEPNPPTTAR